MEYVLIFIVCLILISFPIIYGKYRCDHPEFKDPFQTKLNIGDLDGWSVIHILEFTLLGYLFPTKFILLMVLGIIWESFEFYYSFHKPTFLKGFGHCITSDTQNKENKNNPIWWYGKVSDVVCNFIGIILGMYIRNNLKL